MTSDLREPSVATTIEGAGGGPLVVRRWSVGGRTPQGAVLVVPAMATRSSYYAAVARWIAEQGWVAYTFDYQGYGDSATRPSLRGVEADMFTWAGDAAAVLSWVRQDEPELPVTWLGHSLGGQLLAFAPHAQVAHAVFVASGTGYWKLSEGKVRVLAPLLWYVAAPALTPLFGYFPGRRIGLVGDLPAPVIRQWAGWCKNPDYLRGAHPELEQTFADVRVPLTAITFSDDQTMSEAASASLESYYRNAPVTRVRVRPADHDRERIGHMGLFRRGNEDLWHTLLLPELSVRPA